MTAVHGGGWSVPFEEDDWVGGVLRFGETADAPAISITRRDERCSIVNIDPGSARRTAEVLKAIVRTRDNQAGVYGTITRRGRLAVGQPVYFESVVQWLLEHVEVTSADQAFVWRYLSDVGNWNDPPATFVLHGAFESGTRGETRFPGGEPVTWVLRAVRPGDGYTMESELEGAVLLCEWSFAAASGGGTTLRQRVGVSGPSAAAQAAAVQETFGASLADGMKRIAGILDAASRQP